MEDTENKVEGENLNEPKSYTKEELDAKLKEMQSNSDKGVQKILWEKRAYEQVFDHLSDVSDEPSKLIDLYEDKPEVAQIILNKYYEGKSIEEFKEEIEYEPDYTDPIQIQKQIDKQVESKLKSKLIGDKKEDFIKRLKLEWDEKKEFEKAFEERKELKSFSIDNLEKTFEKAYRDVSKEDFESYNKTIAKAEIMANSWWWTNKWWTKKVSWIESKDNSMRKEVREFKAKFRTE